jgi:hypothetical protein
MCYGENGTVKFLETLVDNVFRPNYSMMQIKKNFAKFKFQKHQNISFVFHTIMTLKCCVAISLLPVYTSLHPQIEFFFCLKGVGLGNPNIFPLFKFFLICIIE